jgi:hypothetical protein
MKRKAIAAQLPGLVFRTHCVEARVTDFFSYDEENLCIEINHSMLSDNIPARLKPKDARALAQWILSVVGETR